eukprot:122905_1
MLPLMNCDPINEANFVNPSKKRKINECHNWRNNAKVPPNITTITNVNTMKSITNINMEQNNGMKAIPRTEDVIIHLKVDLLQLYTSTQQSLSVVRNRLCGQCQGKGASTCNIKPDPNLTSQCNRCFGRGVFPDEKQFTFSVQGHAHNERIIFKHEADQKRGHQAGDIVVVLNQIPDPQFQREGPHLYIKKEIVLVQALCGGEFYIRHLNGRILKFNTRPGEVLAPYQIKCIPNEGMPYKNDVNRRGHIFVQFEVKFPPQPSNPHLINVLMRFLPTPPPDPLQDMVKREPNRLVNCEIVDLAYPRPNDPYDKTHDMCNENNNNRHPMTD